jgi:Outer membrane protein beta-barrel domain
MQVNSIGIMEAIMHLRIFALSLAALALLLAPSSQAWAADKGDAYFGYSRVGANLYAPNTSGMNGWQAAAHVKVIPFVGIEGDVSHYSQSQLGFSQQVTLAMVGPRVTAGFAGFSVFAHGLAGLAHESASVTTFPSASYNAVSYALGAGADVPLFLVFKVRVTGDYLGNSNAPSSGSPSPSHYRIGVGVAYHF